MLPFNLSFLIPSLIAALAIALYLREYFLRRKSLKEVQRVNFETKQESIQILEAARMAQTEIISEGNYATQKLVSEFRVQLQNLINSSEKSLVEPQDSFIQFMNNLQKRSLEFEEASKAATEKRINQTFEHLETRLSDFLIQTEQKTTSSLELDIKATRELIETYKNQQLRLIDENIIAMMEQTMNIVLGKKVSLNDQLDLVYEALEKAKVDKFIV